MLNEGKSCWRFEIFLSFFFSRMRCVVRRNDINDSLIDRFAYSCSILHRLNRRIAFNFMSECGVVLITKPKVMYTSLCGDSFFAQGFC